MYAAAPTAAVGKHRANRRPPAPAGEQDVPPHVPSALLPPPPCATGQKPAAAAHRRDSPSWRRPKTRRFRPKKGRPRKRRAALHTRVRATRHSCMSHPRWSSCRNTSRGTCLPEPRTSFTVPPRAHGLDLPEKGAVLRGPLDAPQVGLRPIAPGAIRRQLHAGNPSGAHPALPPINDAAAAPRSGRWAM